MQYYDIYWQRQLKRKLGNPRFRLKVISSIAMGVFVMLILGVVSVGFLFAWYAKDLPRPDKVQRSEGLSTVVLDRNGERLYDIFTDENRIPAKWEDIPIYLRQATLSIEDKNFYQHQGLSLAGIFRGMTACVFRRGCQGGSTLTQQLVKNVLLSGERTLPRKMKEAILAIQIERKYTKDEILQMYLNEAPYGGTAVGVAAAAQDYFGKSVRDLDLVESAVLAGLPQAPSYYSPFGENPQAYVIRAQNVLRRMREDGYIDADQEKSAAAALPEVKFTTGSPGLRAPHFVAYVKELLAEKIGEKAVLAGGLTVTTTLDWKIQEKAQQIVAEEVAKAKYLKVSNGAAVVITPQNGEILAMVGSKDYSASESGGYKFNVATQGLRQPGSAIKPITYATAFKKGYTASTALMDVDTKYPSGDPNKPDYNPKNYDGKFRGLIQLRYALANSINTIAVKVTALVGIRDVLSTAYDMGLSTLAPTDDNLKRFGLSITLGGGEVRLLDLTSAFGVFARGGLRNDPVAILKVVNNKGQVLYENQKIEPRRVIGADVAYLISDILSDNDARKEVFGPSSYLVISGKSVAVKTGTTDDKRDNWTVGYTKSFTVGTWVGNNDNSPMNPQLASGVTGAAPIWNRIMKLVLKDRADEPFDRPENVIEMEIDPYGGGLPVGDGPRRLERFIKGTEPNGPAPVYQTLKLSKRDNNRLANPVEVNKGEYDSKTFVIIRESDPVSTDGKNRWQESIDAWIAGQGDQKFHPPTEVYSGSTDQISVNIIEPGDRQQVNGNSFRVVAEAASLNDIDKIQILVDNSIVAETDSKRYADNITVGNGSHLLKAKAIDVRGNTSEAVVAIGINQPYVPPTPTPTPKPTPKPTHTISPTPTPP